MTSSIMPESSDKLSYIIIKKIQPKIKVHRSTYLALQKGKIMFCLLLFTFFYLAMPSKHFLLWFLKEKMLVFYVSNKELNIFSIGIVNFSIQKQNKFLSFSNYCPSYLHCYLMTLEQWFSTGVLRHTREPWPVARGAANLLNSLIFIPIWPSPYIYIT